MAWTSPKTWASGYVVLAADLNTHLRDNLNMTAPAVGNGGTGATTFTANGILVGNGTSAVAVTATMATKGHLMVGDGSGAPSMLAVGSNDQVLTADSGEATGLKWSDAGGGGVALAAQDFAYIRLFGH